MDIPVIKTFIFNNKFYVYDAYSNKLLNISKDHYLEISHLAQLGINNYLSLNQTNQSYKDIVLLLNKGMFKSDFIKEIKHPYSEYVPVLLERLISGITLQVTRKCNFKCRYCVISKDNEIGRTHENIDMPWKIAKQSIDFLFNCSKDAKEITVAFYGGEPMMNYKLIMDTINYCKERFLSKKVNYMMTINGSILSKEMILFLSEHKVNISISLDGNKDTQNKHRRFRDTGGETFDVVYNNVKLIQEVDLNYYHKYVSFIPVVFRDENYQETIDFFASLGKKEEKIHKLDVSLNGIDYIYPLSNSKMDQQNDYSEKTQKFMSIYKDKSLIPSVWHHNGPCVPLKRILVDTQGGINICEKVENLKIGDVFSGIDEEQVLKYLNIGKATENQCKKCWAMRFCSMCILGCYDVETHGISTIRKEKNCIRHREDVLDFFKKSLLSNDIGLTN